MLYGFIVKVLLFRMHTLLYSLPIHMNTAFCAYMTHKHVHYMYSDWGTVHAFEPW